MRDYQTKINLGGGPDSITNTKYGADEFNSLAVENENAVSRSGQTLAPADGTGEVSTQLAGSLFLHGTKSSSFQAAGTVDAITLTPISGASGVLIPADYSNIEGAKINFIPTGANTGNVTISIGQTGGTQLGTKKALDEAGAELAAGTLGSTRVEFVYDATADSSNGAWILTPWSTILSDDGIFKAWVNFDGTGVVAIQDSFNVTSITDNGVGDYTVNFTTAFANSNYCALANTSESSTPQTILVGCFYETMTTTTARVNISEAGSGLFDSAGVNCAFVGQQ